ncbi:hypothetical protein NDU88_006951 [Pleurodeles waltl]|uniref:PDZ domain-containing protein n=1 Tax=Pleurodeles waltl TaxID=8319 RepID=A0AAV7VR70_PLEWA|nr:hypothetical protein NDU88_006951 [Pleurodeles waltl]
MLGKQDATNEDDIVAISLELGKSKEAQAKMEEDIKALWDKCTGLEDRPKRDNTKIHNVCENKDKMNTITVCQSLFQHILKEKRSTDIPIVQAHRVDASREVPGLRPRDIIVKLGSLQLKDTKI